MGPKIDPWGISFIEGPVYNYGLGYPRQPSPRVTLGEIFFHSFVLKIHEVGETTDSGRRVAGRRDNFFACKQFDLTTRDETAKS